MSLNRSNFSTISWFFGPIVEIEEGEGIGNVGQSLVKDTKKEVFMVFKRVKKVKNGGEGIKSGNSEERTGRY